LSTKYKAILLVGAPGSGKGTHGKWLGNLLGFVHISSGDLFRALDKNSKLGRIFVEYSNRGQLVPDEFTVQLWQEHMQRLIAAKKFNPATETVVLDGIPRDVPQAKMLDPHIAVQKIIVIHVEHGLDEIIARMKARALIEGRQDDANEATIRHRFEVYETETKPVLDYYPAHLRLDINGLQGGPIPVAHDILAGILGRNTEMKPLPR
jgi:adenylate kinase